YKYGKLDGAFTVYHESGGVAGKGRYKDGVPDGQFPEWWIDGSLSRTEIWESGKLVDTVYPEKKK
ncbi:MAG: toxin-antitoxin system YwqK family antitoxin, partial [Verrucomicrobia bacterium]|nr:toxin-antitoxin system YwqK family antitoxin [Verrucomicrobiota bacterium]